MKFLDLLHAKKQLLIAEEKLLRKQIRDNEKIHVVQNLIAEVLEKRTERDLLESLIKAHVLVGTRAFDGGVRSIVKEAEELEEEYRLNIDAVEMD